MIAEVIQRVRPDVLLINEFDYDAQGAAGRLFQHNYLSRPQGSTTGPASTPQSGGTQPLRFAYRFTAPVNTGVPTGFDLDRDGKRDYGGADAYGFGDFPGQYGMVVYSRFAIDRARVRTFQTLTWASMPGALWPDDPATPSPGDWYSDAQKAALRLSSKSHWDLSLLLPGGRRVHFLVSHPTPPAFDGPEDRNGLRNHDEIRFWVDYLDPARAGWIHDDAGTAGGLAAAESFVIAGDLNSDPNDGSSRHEAIRALLNAARVGPEASVGARVPASAGARAAAERQQGPSAAQRGDAAQDTADFGDDARGAGNLRVDYVLPSRDLKVCGSGVFWPTPADPNWRLVNDDTRRSSDHRLVWVDVAIDGPCPVMSDSLTR